MENILPIVYYVYAVVLLGGGVMGSMVSKKPSSLLGSLAFGAVAVAAGIVMRSNPKVGLVIGLIDALAVSAFFVYRYNVTHKAMPAFPSIGLSLIVIALSVAAMVTAGKTGAPELPR